MPPKQQSKVDMAKKQKTVEDKTFGLKNKNKSKNVQKYVQSLKQSVQPRPDSSKIDAKKKKEEEKAREKELSELFKVAVSQPKVPLGVDPKSILCEFFKVGQCAKGFKCKFSHDLNVQRKGEKIDIYSDQRDEEEEKETMEDWDQEMLEKVIQSKSQEYNKNKPTDIVCKYFLEAVEKKQYGWFWVCPNGDKDCHYRHALPPGYILKSQMKALIEEEADKLPIEEEIENQRAKITASTPMTPELFMQWKKKKVEEQEAGLAAQRAERAKNDRMSGRELFLSDASLFVDDAEAYDKYQREEEPDAEKKVDKGSFMGGPSSSMATTCDTEDVADNDGDDDDDLDMDELNELEASLSKTTLQIREPGEWELPQLFKLIYLQIHSSWSPAARSFQMPVIDVCALRNQLPLAVGVGFTSFVGVNLHRFARHLDQPSSHP
ncbi:Zinc finger CCCH domain-containing protein 21 [Forsythia ovata]|uniref:Zinc finger CCCH domain-containing protein 21 n=1 Tax=Forsythia ovata TaxID=205694 RepID=A0ABD1WYA3_9LAMI